MKRLTYKGNASSRIVVGIVAAIIISAGVMATTRKSLPCNFDGVYDNDTSTLDYIVPENHVARFDLSGLTSNTTYQLFIDDSNFASDGWSTSSSGTGDGKSAANAGHFSVNQDFSFTTGASQSSISIYINTARMNKPAQNPVFSLKNVVPPCSYSSAVIAIQLSSAPSTQNTASSPVSPINFTALGAIGSFTVSKDASKWAAMGSPSGTPPTFSGTPMQHSSTGGGTTPVSLVNGSSQTVATSNVSLIDQ